MISVLAATGLGVRYPRPGRLASRVRGDHRPWVDVVRDVSFEIGRGETLALVGESGSGKTSLAMALMGLVPLHEGEVRIAGTPVSKDRRGRLRPDRRRLAMTFQDAAGSLSPRMTVRAALAEPFRIHGRGKPEIEALRLLDLVGLGAELADRYPHQLSGGQARRVGVARALALEPELVIADEPTAGLDVSVQGDVLNLLSDLQSRLGLAILIITHNLNVVRHVSDRMAIMYLGRVVEQGASEAVFRHPRHPYTKALLSANPSSHPEAAADRLELTGEIPSPLRRPSGCEFHPRCPFVQDDCRHTPPPAGRAGPEHRFRCLHPLPAG